MNIFLWIVQILLAIHTALGAFWKFSNPVEAMPTLQEISYNGWIALSVAELVCVVVLFAPLFKKRLNLLVPAASTLIAAEMLFFSWLHLSSGNSDKGPVIYWMVVAVVCAFLATMRLVRRK